MQCEAQREIPWHIRRVGFPAAWRIAAARAPGQRPVRIGILDSGVDLQHPLLQGLLGPGANLLRPGDPPLDENGHGTHVAGIIAAAIGAWSLPHGRKSSHRSTGAPKGKNGVLALNNSTKDTHDSCLSAGNLSGQPWLVLHPVKIFDRTGYGRVGDIVRGLYWCAEQGMDVINLSFGTDGKTSRALHLAVQELEAAGILLIGAAGNDGRRSSVDFPGRYPEVLAVAASNRSDRLATFSSFGPEVDLVAPGSGVVSLAPGGTFVRMSGTSMAAPHVTAAAALLLRMEPHLSPAGVRRRMTASAEWLPLVHPQTQGAGLLRADRMLRP